MPRVQLSYVVTFSSEDPRHKVDNLLKSDGIKKWLSSAGDRSGRLEGVFQLERACQISHIDVGTYNTFSVQILVGRSSWPSSQEYRTLVASSTFMTPVECRMGKNRDGMRMFNKEHFASELVLERWDRVKVVCTQPFRKDAQYGLSVLRVQSDQVPHQQLQSTPSPGKDKEPATVPGPQSSGDIHKHFFGTQIISPAGKKHKSAELETSLAQIGATTENGSAQEARLSRNTRLVLAAAGVTGTPKYHRPNQSSAVRSPVISSTPQTDTTKSLISSPPPKSTMTVQRTIQKVRIPFEVEVNEFLSGISFADIDVENFTFADLRHKFEKHKMRKLSKDERKIFFKKSQDHVDKVFSSSSVDGTASNNNNNSGNIDSNNCSRTPLTEKPMQKTSSEPRTKSPVSKRQLLIERMQNVQAKTNTPGSAFARQDKLKVKPTSGPNIRRSLNKELIISDKDKTGNPEANVNNGIDSSLPTVSPTVCISKSDAGMLKHTPHSCSNSDTIQIDSSRDEIVIEEDSPENPTRQNARENRMKSLAKEIIITDPSPDDCLRSRSVRADNLDSACTPNSSVKRKFDSESFQTGSPEEVFKKRRTDLLSESQVVTAEKKKKKKKCSRLHQVISFDSDSDVEDSLKDTNNMWLSRDSPLHTDKNVRSKGRGRARGRGKVRGTGPKVDVSKNNSDIIIDNANDSVTVEGAFEEAAAISLGVENRALIAVGSCANTSRGSDNYDVYQNFVMCPICDGMYAKQSIETHAARCGLIEDDPPASSTTVIAAGGRRGLAGAGEGECPLCQAIFPLYLLEDHASVCASLQDGTYGEY